MFFNRQLGAPFGLVYNKLAVVFAGYSLKSEGELGSTTVLEKIQVLVRRKR